MSCLPVLSRGSRGPAVRRWIIFLVGERLYSARVDSSFGPATERGTRALQRRAAKSGFPIGAIDGEVETKTYAYAGVCGFQLAPPVETRKHAHRPLRSGPYWPKRPANLRPLGSAGRRREFGDFKYKAAPTKRNAEAIKITDRRGLKLEKLYIPHLLGVPGFPASGEILIHTRVAEQLGELVYAWHVAGLIHLIQGWSGSYAPRFIRGSSTTLSSHSWGSAFDINYVGNQLGRVPALKGDQGSVRELVPLAIKHGFYWGGWFSRRDGMHFECCEPRGPRI